MRRLADKNQKMSVLVQGSLWTEKVEARRTTGWGILHRLVAKMKQCMSREVGHVNIISYNSRTFSERHVASEVKI